MKTSEFQKLIKKVVKEAIHEELKDILLEALKSSKSQISENSSLGSLKETKSPDNISYAEKRKKYADILNETKLSFTSNDVNKFVPNPNMDVTKGELPPGDVDLSQIQQFISK